MDNTFYAGLILALLLGGLKLYLWAKSYGWLRSRDAEIDYLADWEESEIEWREEDDALMSIVKGKDYE